MNNARAGIRFFAMLAGLLVLLAMPARAAVICIGMDTSTRNGTSALMLFDLVDGDGVDSTSKCTTEANKGARGRAVHAPLFLPLRGKTQRRFRLDHDGQLHYC